jgi:hypothetical protein
MKFIHNDPEWEQLLAIVADKHPDIGIAMVEKDYWVVHTLWSIQQAGFEIGFKGGTSLSKGFDLIQRFSEDIDVRLGPGTTGLVEPTWSLSNKKQGPPARDAWFSAVTARLADHVADCEVIREPDLDELVRGTEIRVVYPGRHIEGLPESMVRDVKLEVGWARVEPGAHVDISSWVHDHLNEIGLLGEYEDSRPMQVHCIHPLGTCIEKLDAIRKKFARDDLAAATFARHYEDCAWILRHRSRLPPLDSSLAELVETMRVTQEKKRLPGPEDPSLNPDNGARWAEVGAALAAIQPMFWGERIPLEVLTRELRDFVAQLRSG